MAFKEKEQKEIVVNQAWEHLHQRLENDGLLSEENRQETGRRQTASFSRLYVAAVLIACCFTGWLLTRNTNSPNTTLKVMHNAANAPTLATMLEDGSIVYLSERATLKYPNHFDDNKREVVLQGEAFFDVKKQAERPFLIETDLAKIEVIGTSFKIKSDDESSFLLSVREGEVRVTQKSRQQTLTVEAGETVLFDSEQLQLIKSSIRFDDYFRRIHFKDEKLTHVASILNMHSDSVKIEVEPELEARLLTFTLPEKTDISEIAQLICRALDLQYTRQNRSIYISSQK